MSGCMLPQFQTQSLEGAGKRGGGVGSSVFRCSCEGTSCFMFCALFTCPCVLCGLETFSARLELSAGLSEQSRVRWLSSCPGIICFSVSIFPGRNHEKLRSLRSGLRCGAGPDILYFAHGFCRQGGAQRVAICCPKS